MSPISSLSLLCARSRGKSRGPDLIVTDDGSRAGILPSFSDMNSGPSSRIWRSRDRQTCKKASGSAKGELTESMNIVDDVSSTTSSHLYQSGSTVNILSPNARITTSIDLNISQRESITSAIPKDSITLQCTSNLDCSSSLVRRGSKSCKHLSRSTELDRIKNGQSSVGA